MISMPKGSYAICFETRSPEAAPEVPVADPPPPAAAIPLAPRHHWWRWASVCVIVATLTGVVAAAWTRLKPGDKSIRPQPAPALMLPFSAVIAPAKDTYVVTSDTSLVLIEDLRRQRVSLEDYITGRYTAETAEPADRAMQDMIRVLLKRRYTNAAEAGIAGRIMERNSWASQRLFLRSGHGVQLADFKHHNAILFGSPSSNPWAGLFTGKLNFQYDWDQSRRGRFRNRSPRPGEQSVYSMTTNSGDVGTAYAVVALVPNADGDGSVLLIFGTTAEGTEAAGEFITDETRTAAALNALGIDPAGPPRYFEILLEAQAIAGSASASKIVSSRLIPVSR